MKQIKIVSIVFLSLLILTGCFNAEEEKLRVQENVEPFYKSLLFEDIDATMTFLYEGTDFYYESYQRFLGEFNSYNLLYKVQKIEFITVTKEQIEIDVDLWVTGINESKEKIDKIIKQHITYKKNSNGDWKISLISDKEQD